MNGSNSDVPRLQSFTLGDWLVDPRACQMSRGEDVAKLRPQLVDVLLCLSRRAGQIVLKEEILAEVWPGQFIADSGLSRCIAELRAILQDDPQAPRFIETIPKRGYRLTAAVAWLPGHPGELAPAPATAGGTDTGLPTPVPADEGAVSPAEGGRLAKGSTAGSWRSSWWGRWRWAAVAILLLTAAVVATILRTRARPVVVLTDRDPVLLAFENRTGDAVFDEVVPLAMSIQLEQSPHLALLSPGRVAEVLQMMRRPPDTAITRAVGLELCERAGAHALIVTSIASLGRQYAIGLEAVACGTGQVLVRRQVTADRKENLLDGLQRAAAGIRSALGEPASTLARYNVPIVEATTASLDALRALRQGDLAREQGQRASALEFYRAAVSRDPDFALAQSRLARAALIHGTEKEAHEAYARALALRDRVTLPERLEIELNYHRFVTGDQEKIFETLERLRRNYPTRAWIRQFLALEYQQVGRYDEALAEALEAQRLEPESPRVLAAVASISLCLNRLAEARATAERGLALSPDHAALHLLLLQCALAQNDDALRARERAWAAQHADAAAPYTGLVEADDAMARGRLREALGLLAREEAWATSGQRPARASSIRFWMARYEALAGFRERALRRLHEELRRGGEPGQLLEAVKVAASAGDLALTQRLLDEVERALSPGVQPDATLVRVYRSAIESSRGRAPAALAAFTQLEPLELGFLFEYIPLFERARANELAGRWAAAQQAYEKLLANPHCADRKLLPLAQLGLARSRAGAGDVAGARAAYERFFERLRDADPDLPLLLQARRGYAALAK